MSKYQIMYAAAISIFHDQRYSAMGMFVNVDINGLLRGKQSVPTIDCLKYSSPVPRDNETATAFS